MAVIHPSFKSSKGPGVVILSSKMLKPKCISCRGNDCCVHLAIHLHKYKQQLKETNNNSKRLKIDRLELVRPQKKGIITEGDLDPFQYEGPEANVFRINIDFFQAKQMESQNKKISAHQENFQTDVLIAKFDNNKVCKRHNNKFEEEESIVFTESTNIVIHHTKEVDTVNKVALYRPTVSTSDSAGCDCKLFYTGEDDRLVRVSATKNSMAGRKRTLHFVSFEYYFNYLAQLVEGGETMTAFIKSQKFMSEVFFGDEKSPEHRNIKQKGFEIFCHSLRFPEDANFCYECPQRLGDNEHEDAFKDDIEYSIIDGLQMGCRSNDMKAAIKDEYFEEEVVENVVVNGIEAKDRTFLNSQGIRNVIKNLLSKADHPTALCHAIETLGSMNLDGNANFSFAGALFK